MRSPAAADELCSRRIVRVVELDSSCVPSFNACIAQERRQRPHVLSEISHVELAECCLHVRRNEKNSALAKFFIDNSSRQTYTCAANREHVTTHFGLGGVSAGNWGRWCPTALLVFGNEKLSPPSLPRLRCRSVGG